MDQSDSRPQLGGRLRQCLAVLPRRRPPRRTRLGLFGSDDDLPNMMLSHDPGGASPSRIATAHILPSFDGKNSASANFHISGLTTAPCMAPVYASDPALPRRPQDSVPACPLRLWPDETFTHKSSAASPNALRQGGGNSGVI